MAAIEKGDCRLGSRNGHTYRTFDPLRAAVVRELNAKDTLLDGEIVCLNAEGRSLFNRCCSAAAARRTPCPTSCG